MKLILRFKLSSFAIAWMLAFACNTDAAEIKLLLPLARHAYQTNEAAVPEC